MKTYYLTFIYRDKTEDYKDFSTEIYRFAYNTALEKMEDDTSINATLIYTNIGSTIVIKRHWVKRMKDLKQVGYGQ